MRRTAEAVIGVDVGTTAVKAIVVDAGWRVLGESEVGQTLSTPRPGWSEQHPEQWWSGAGDAIAAAVGATRKLSRGVEIKAIGLAGRCTALYSWMPKAT